MEESKKIEESKGQEAQEPEKPSQFDWNKFWEQSEINKQLTRLLELWNKNIDTKEKNTIRQHRRFLAISIIFFLAVVGTVIWLTLANRISSEATSFLLGVIITGAISIIRDFTGGK